MWQPHPLSIMLGLYLENRPLLVTSIIKSSRRGVYSRAPLDYSRLITRLTMKGRLLQYRRLIETIVLNFTQTTSNIIIKLQIIFISMNTQIKNAPWPCREKSNTDRQLMFLLTMLRWRVWPSVEESITCGLVCAVCDAFQATQEVRHKSSFF